MNRGIIRFLSTGMLVFSIAVSSGLFLRECRADGGWSAMKLRVDLRGVPKETAMALYSSGYDVVTTRPDGSVEIIASPEDYLRLVSDGFEVTVLVRDLRERLVSLYGRSSGLGGLREYHSYDETVQEMMDIQNDHPSITRLEVVGTSIEGRDIYAMKISDNADIDEEEPEVLFTGLHHAREPITLEICLDLLNYLTDYYGSQPQVTELVDERETWVIPIVNPDGYEYAQNIDPYWRKNRRNNGNGTWGVDINRNYGYKWGWDDIGSGSRSDDPTYRGTAPFSEPETRAVRDLCEAHDFAITVSHHSYGDYVLYPWGYVYGATDDDVAFEGIGNELSSMNGYEAGRTSVVLYKVNGDFADWQFGEARTKTSNLGFTIETGSDFYPPPNQIPPLVQEGRQHNLYYLSIADTPYRFAPPPPPIIEPMPVDDDGSYTVSWSSPNQGRRDAAIRYELQELDDETIIIDDIESGTSNWVLDGFSSSSARSHSGTRSLFSGSSDYRSSTAVFLADYKVRLGDELTFWTWYDIEDDYDYAYVEVSTDGGLSFETIPGDITTNSNPNGNNEGNGINGSSNGWIFATFHLSAFRGEHVKVRFRYSTDANTLGAGFYVDDVDLISTYGSIQTLSSNIIDTGFPVSGREEGIYFYRVRGIDEDDQWSSWSPIEAVWVVSTPYLDVTLTPDVTEVSPGEVLGFTGEITNLSTDPESFEAWFDLIMPDGRPLPSNPFIGPAVLSMPAGGTLTRHLSVTVPQNAFIGGPWTLILRSGNHPAGVISEDSFQFDIVAPRIGSLSSVSGAD